MESWDVRTSNGWTFRGRDSGIRDHGVAADDGAVCRRSSRPAAGEHRDEHNRRARRRRRRSTRRRHASRRLGPPSHRHRVGGCCGALAPHKCGSSGAATAVFPCRSGRGRGGPFHIGPRHPGEQRLSSSRCFETPVGDRGRSGPCRSGLASRRTPSGSLKYARTHRLRARRGHPARRPVGAELRLVAERIHGRR